MRALLLRLYRYTGARGILFLVFCGTGCIAIFLDGGFGALIKGGSALGMMIGVIAGTAVAATNYRRSSATHSYDEILTPLLRSKEEYCLVLRPFGRDGEVILPRATPSGDVAGGLFTGNATMEQVVVTAVHKALNLDTYAIVDQKVSVAPPGLLFLRVANDDWKMVAEHLIRRAHSIILILSPFSELGGGFAWEIEQIVRYGMGRRVVIVLPPCDQDARTHREAVEDTGVILAMLEGSGRREDLNGGRAGEYQRVLSTNTLVVRWSQESGAVPWNLMNGEPQMRALRGPKMRVADRSYVSVLTEALNRIEEEMSGWDFDRRYPWA